MGNGGGCTCSECPNVPRNIRCTSCKELYFGDRFLPECPIQAPGIDYRMSWRPLCRRTASSGQRKRYLCVWWRACGLGRGMRRTEEHWRWWLPLCNSEIECRGLSVSNCRFPVPKTKVPRPIVVSTSNSLSHAVVCEVITYRQS